MMMSNADKIADQEQQVSHEVVTPGDPLDNFSRLMALYRLALLDSPPEESFDRVTRLLVRLTGVPVVLISLLDFNRQFFKSQVGLGEPWASKRETPLSHSFCQYVVTSGQPLIITDARENALVADNLAISELQVIAYAGVPISAPDGEVLGSLCMIDHVPHAWTEQELSALDDLAAMLETEITLRSQMIDATRQNEDLNAFSHMAAHNLKGPLNLIGGYAQVAQLSLEQQQFSELSNYLSQIEWCSLKMGNIINDLLLLARISQTGVEMGVLDMSQIVSDVLLRLGDVLDDHQPTLIQPKHWPAAVGYAPWVEEIWANYLSNAMKYGGDPMRIEIGADPLADGSVRFWVKDNGAGITAKDQAELFKPFTRFSDRKEEIDGHGLGLSIVRRIAEKLNGTVAAQSEVGKGSTFSFTLPTVVRARTAAAHFGQE